MPFFFGFLGVSGLVPIFTFLLIAPIFAFIVRRKWRKAAARKEEIRRLMILASEEAARAELETAVVYGAVPLPSAHHQCAVCYCPTTTRCSRCKEVRYCSGKCQIIHWRQGHKDECHPPPTTVHFNDTRTESDLTSVLHAKQSDVEWNNLEAEDNRHARPVQKFTERPSSESNCSSTVLGVKGTDEKFEPSVNVTGTDRSTFKSKADYSPSISSTLREPLVCVSVHECCVSSCSDVPDEIAHEVSKPASDVVVPNLAKSHASEFTSLYNDLSTFSCSSKTKHDTLGSKNGPVDCESNSSLGPNFNTSNECTVGESSPAASLNATLDSSRIESDGHDDCTQSAFRDSDHSDSVFRFSFNLSRQPVPPTLSNGTNPRTLVSDDANRSNLGMPRVASLKKLVVEGPLSLGFEGPSSISGEKSDNEQLMKSREPVSSSFGASADHASSGSRNTPPSVTSSNVNDVLTVPALSETINSAPLGGNSLKTSMRKVVQQFKPSKTSKQSLFASEIAGKYNFKMLFPYDLFLKLYSDKVELRPCGLTNCGNSCYANAVLQCLAFTRPLTAYLLQGFHAKSCPKKEWCFTCEFESLVLKTKDGKSPISPIRILSQIQSIGSHLGHGREEDAHEFLRYAIDAMQAGCLKEAGVNAKAHLAEETTLIQLVFGGYLRSKIKCMKCQGKSERRERMMDLTVEIHGDIGTLEEALTRFTATEILDGDNKYKCGRCKSYEKAKKKLTVLEAPNILTIALKRFQSGKFGKLNKSVRFSEILNLAPYMSGTDDKSPIYKLYAVVVHLDVMNAAFSGHYVCYVKDVHGKWFKIDDSTVKPVELDRVLSKAAYMLLYARCSPRAPSLIRSGMSHDHAKSKSGKSTETIPSCHSGRNLLKGRSNPPVPPFVGLRREEDPYWMAPAGPPNFGSSDSLVERFFPVYRIPRTDSSSDNSSLLSCSDEGSCSTESTRDSTSTDDYSEYFFGDSGRFSWNSPSRPLEDSDASYSPSFSRSSPLSASTNRHVLSSPESGDSTSNFSPFCHDDALNGKSHQPQERRVVSQGKESPLFLYSDTTKQSRKLTDHRSSSNADWEVLGWANPSNMKSSGVSLRKPWERAAKTFY